MHTVRSLVLDPAIRLLRRGPRTVLWTPERVFLGNFLYHWLVAHAAQDRGEDVVARATPAMAPWLDLLPVGRDTLVVRPKDVRFTDRRRLGFFQEFGVDYTGRQLGCFVDEVLLGSPLLTRTSSVTLGLDDLAVNVRRGDFYSDPEFRARFGFDTVRYLRSALEKATEVGGAPRRIHVVSDDVPWCRSALSDLAPGTELTFSTGGDPADDFAVLAAAPRLVGTNSTFGYWAAHAGDRMHRHGARQVVMPSFHDRSVLGGRAYQLNPAWTVVDVDPRDGAATAER